VTPLKRAFDIVAVTEAASFLALLVATYVKYGHDQEIGVQILGPLHGFLFVAYFMLALYLAPRENWSVKVTALVLLGAVLPFGGFVVHRWLKRRPLEPAVG
jgi:integral membrane protein